MTDLVKPSNIFLAWKNNKITRFGTTKIWGLFLQIKSVLAIHKYYLLGMNFHFKNIYCYIYQNNDFFFFLKEKTTFINLMNKSKFCIKVKLFKNILFLNYKLLTIFNLYTIINYKLRVSLNTLFIKSFFSYYIKYFCKTKLFFNRYLTNYKNKFFISLKNKTKINKFIKSNLELKNLTLLIQYYFKNKTSLNHSFRLKVIQNLNLFNCKWFGNQVLLKTLYKQFKFKFNFLVWVVVFYLCEKLRQSNLLLEAILWFFHQNKILKKKKFSMKVLLMLEKIYFFLRTTKCIFFKGMEINLSGKIKQSMRKKKYIFSTGKIGFFSKQNFISESFSAFVARPGLIHLKVSLFF